MKFIRDIIGEKRERSLSETGPVPGNDPMAGVQVLPDLDKSMSGWVDDGELADEPLNEDFSEVSRDTMVLTEAQRLLAERAARLAQPAGDAPHMHQDETAAYEEETQTSVADTAYIASPADLLQTHESRLGGEPSDNDMSHLHAEPAKPATPLEEPFPVAGASAMPSPMGGVQNPASGAHAMPSQRMEMPPEEAKAANPVPPMQSNPRESLDFGGLPLVDDGDTQVEDNPEQYAQTMPSGGFPEAGNVDVPAPSMGRGGGRGGRVKTRLLGFGAQAAAATDPIAAAQQNGAGVSQFPVGWLVVAKGPGRGAAFTLFSGVTSIGRAETQTVSLDYGDNSISRENHAAIAFDPEQGRFFVGHGGKANLVRLNDRPVLATEELENGATIRIGETTLRFVSLCGPAFSWETD